MALIETETTTSAGFCVMKCTECGRTCVQNDDVYEYCPHCGCLACSSIYESYFSTKSAIASNWYLLRDLMDGDLTFVERLKLLNMPYTYLNSEDFLKEEV